MDACTVTEAHIHKRYAANRSGNVKRMPAMVADALNGSPKLNQKFRNIESLFLNRSVKWRLAIIIRLVDLGISLLQQAADYGILAVFNGDRELVSRRSFINS